MALNWDLGACADQHAVFTFGRMEGEDFIPDPNGTKRQLKPHAEAAIWLTMSIMVGRWTEKNIEEVFQRIHMYEHARGAFRRTEKGEKFFTLDEVKTLIGLTTNVGDDTRSAFHKNLIRMMSEDAANALIRAKHPKPPTVAKENGDAAA